MESLRAYFKRIRGVRPSGHKPPVTPPTDPQPPLGDLLYSFVHHYPTLEANRTKYRAHLAGTVNEPAVYKAAAQWVSDANNLLNAGLITLGTRPTHYQGKAIDYGPYTNPRDMIDLVYDLWPRTVNKITGGVGSYDASLAYVLPDYSAAANTMGALVGGNGYPYVQRSGIKNPEANLFQDVPKVKQVSGNVETLGLGYFFSGNELYAQKALDFLYTFLCDPVKGMNPHVRFVSIYKGYPEYQGYGAGTAFVHIDPLAKACEGLQLLRGSDAYKERTQQVAALEAWFTQMWEYNIKEWNPSPAQPAVTASAAVKENFYHWRQLRDTEKSRGIYAQWNNIRVAYSCTVLSYAMLLGKYDWARSYIQRYIFDYQGKQGLISRSIAVASGSYQGIAYTAGDLLLENWRTKPITYTWKALEYLADLCVIADNLGLDVAGYVAPNGATLKSAVSKVMGYIENPDSYPRKEKQSYATSSFYRLPASRLRVLAGFFATDTALLNRIRAYLNTQPSEAEFQTGTNRERATTRIGY